MGKGSTTTSSTTSSADPQAAAAYRQLLTQAGSVASTPYQAYSGQLVAPINSQQQTGIDNINSNANYAQPYINQAAGYANQSAQAITPDQIAQYQNPYTQSVVDATQAQFTNQNQQAQQGLTSNAIAQGALGGNRTGVASANLANQQQLAQAPVIAGLYNQSYQQALGAAQQDAQRQGAAAYSLGNLGVAGQNAALSGAGAQLGAGTLQQQTQQNQDTANYGQYTQQQAYPFQTLQWLAGLQTGVGSQLGGTSTGQTTTPPPNPWGQIAGLGLAAASFLKDGGRVRPHFDSGGGVAGTPWADAKGWVPTMQIAAGRGAPQASAPSPAKDQGIDPQSIIKQATGLAGAFGKFSGPSYGGGNVFNSEWGGSSSNPLPGLDASDYGADFRRGGVVGYADGGAPSFDDRFKGGLGLAPYLSGDFTAGDPAFDEPPPASFNDRFVGDGSGPGLVPTSDPRVINPDEPYRMPDSKAVDEWRNSTPLYTDNGPSDGGGPMPATRSAGVGAAPPVVAQDDGPDAPAASPGLAPAARAPFSPNDVPYAKSGGLGLLKAIGLDPSDAARSGLLATGLGLLSSRSPNIGNMIGDAGQLGLATYSGARKGEVDSAQEARKLADAADKAAKDIELRTRSIAETERHNKASENKQPNGWELGANGSMVPIKGGPADPDYISRIASAKKPNVGPSINEDTIDLLAERVMAGDTRALVGFGRGAQGAENIAAVQQRVAEKARANNTPVGDAARNILSNAAQNAGFNTAARRQATIMANLSVYGRTAFNATDLAEKASDEIDRTQFQPVNKLLNAYRTKTGDPKIVALGAAVNSLINEYARAISGGRPTVNDKHHAEEMLSTAQTKEQFKAVLNMMRQELTSEERAMPEAKKHIESIYNPSSNSGSHSVSDRGKPQSMGTPKRVQQNGYTYELGSDGKYHPVQ